MPSNKPVIESWHGFKLADGTAEVVLVGYGFGEDTGSVMLNIGGQGSYRATVKQWSPTAIVVAAPADVTVRRAHVNVIDGRGSEKQAAQSPAGQQRTTSSDGSDALWTITGDDSDANVITLSGTDLDLVTDVILYDSAAPNQIILASYLMNGTDLEIDWPASFVAPIAKIRLTSGDDNKVQQVIGGTSGWSPGTIINDVSVQMIGAYPIISLFGSGFGDTEGSVTLHEVGGGAEVHPILHDGWSDSLVQVIAEAGTSYDQIVLARSNGDVADIGVGVEFPIVVPASDPIITAVSSSSLGIRVEGSGFSVATSLNTSRSGVPKNYDAASWFGQNGAEFSDSVIEITADASVDNLPPVTDVQVLTATGASNLVTSPDLGGPWSMDNPDTATLTFDVSVDTGTNRINIVASAPFFGVGANPPFAIELTVSGQLYLMAPSPLSGYWTEDDSTHAHIKDASAWGNVVTDIDFFATGYELVLLAGWDGSVPTS